MKDVIRLERNGARMVRRMFIVLGQRIRFTQRDLECTKTEEHGGVFT